MKYIVVVYILCSIRCFKGNIVDKFYKNLGSTLTDEFNDYVDQTLDILNNKQLNSTFSTLPNHIIKGTWGYLLLDVDYTIRLSSGSVTGVERLQRLGNASIIYDKQTRSLQLSTTILFEQIQASYAVEAKVYGYSHYGTVSCQVTGLTVSITISVNDINLQVTLDNFSVNDTQGVTSTFQGSSPVVSYFAPAITALPTLSLEEVKTMARSAIQSTIDTLNNPNFGYY
uniref:Lipid-binding serum glycoprotein N-terminal domain-containing protein n=1 Tax=Cuerna arida TaxID=1464854 RepID=A0A1B6FE95_9HEMI